MEENLDEQIAVEVMGWTFRPATPSAAWVAFHEDRWLSPRSEGSPPTNMFKRIHPFSTNINRAFEVVEKMRELKKDFRIEAGVRGYGVFCCGHDDFANTLGELPATICRCALLAVTRGVT